MLFDNNKSVWESGTGIPYFGKIAPVQANLVLTASTVYEVHSQSIPSPSLWSSDCFFRHDRQDAGFLGLEAPSSAALWRAPSGNYGGLCEHSYTGQPSKRWSMDECLL